MARTWTHTEKAELANLYHLACTALAGTNPSAYDQNIWASQKYHEAHPDVSSTAAYKELNRQAAWRY